MSEEEKKEKKKSEKLTRDEAEKILLDWAEYWELDPDRQLYKDMIEELRMSVRNNRLTFDKQSERFKYLLIKPVKNCTIVEIKECDFEDKKILQRFGDDESIDAAGASLVKYTNLTTAGVNELSDRDTAKINAVIMGFLAQVAPSRK